jgi:uroporphyrinogen-III decarboxylase
VLTRKQNLLETIRGGTPDRFVNQYEAFAIIPALVELMPFTPIETPDNTWKNAWGVTIFYPPGAPGPMPVHTPGKIVLTDINRWREQVPVPSLDFPESVWQKAAELVASVDRSEQFLTIAMYPGVLENLHYLMGMEEAMTAFYSDPDAVCELCDFYVEWEISYARQFIERFGPDALFHHDDWGSHNSTLISPEMFAEFLVPAYKKLYGFYRANGIEVIMHHSDSYAATLVPAMIEIGIDIWQGVVTTNNIPELVRRYGGQISFFGGINNGLVDRADWSEAQIAREVERACLEGGRHYFICGLTQGGPESIFPGVYQTVSREIERVSREMF